MLQHHYEMRTLDAVARRTRDLWAEAPRDAETATTATPRVQGRPAGSIPGFLARLARRTPRRAETIMAARRLQ